MKCRRCCKEAEHRRKRGFLYFVVMKCGERFCGEQNSQIDRKYLFQAPLTFPYRLISELCLYSRLNGPLFHRTLCGAATWCIVPFVPGHNYPPVCIQFCVCLFVSVCRDLTGPSRESCQRLEDKLSAVHCSACAGNWSFGNSCLENRF